MQVASSAQKVFFIVALAASACWVCVDAEAQTLGLAAQYPNDEGLGDDPAVIYMLDFNDQQQTQAWYGTKDGYAWTNDPNEVVAGGGALEIQQIEGTHIPSEIYTWITETDVAYVRWYRKWERGYDWTQHKMSGVYAWAPGECCGGAGVPPDGYDKYSCKLFVDWGRHPRFYTYHPDQAGIYGDELLPNLVDPATVVLQTQRWYCFEMMIQANTVQPGGTPNYDGELKMWIDGQLVGHYDGMRFRNVETLKINQFTYSAYVGGTWVSLRDQKLWDDQIVVATEYIGPLVEPPVLVSSEPPADGTLAKTQNNVIRLTFDRPITLYGQGLSIFGGGWEEGNAFTYLVEPDGTTLKAIEEGPMLTNLTWYHITPGPGLHVEPFAFDLCTLAGDCNNSGRVTTADYSEVKAYMGEYTDAPYDLNGTGRITTADYSIVKANMGSRAPTKP